MFYLIEFYELEFFEVGSSKFNNYSTYAQILSTLTVLT